MSTRSRESVSHDVVIVGAGVAGALVAKRLTSSGFRVLVLEAGPGDAVVVRRLHAAPRDLPRRQQQGRRVGVAAAPSARRSRTAATYAPATATSSRRAR